MNRLFNVCCVLALFAVVSSANAQPNIVVIISDDQGFGDYGFMGHPVIQTPHLDQLADESLLFTRGYVTTALCSPSLATMLTGLYPHQHRTTGNDPLRGIDRQPWIEHFRGMPQLPALLQDAGYLSFHTGKYWQGDPAVSGFTDSMGATKRHGSEASLGIGRNGIQPIYDFIEKAQGEEKPFLVWYAPFLPHTPHNPPERLEKKYVELGAGAQANYYAMCEWLDETCGDLLGYLDKRELTENTVVLFICDNGWGSLGKGSVKSSPYELGVRTPIMIRWPGQVAPEKNTAHLASNLDLAPTVLAACGVEVPSEMPGIDLLDRDAVAKRKHLFLENFTHDMLDVDLPTAGLRARSCVEKDWKLTVWRTPHPDLKVAGWVMEPPEETTQLFNLKDDPLERNNVAEQHTNKVAELEKLLDAWWNPEAN